MARKWDTNSKCIDCDKSIDPRSYRCRSHRTINLWKIGKHRKLINPEERFWQKVVKTSYCWEWIGFRDKNGYGSFPETHKKSTRAHRFSYRITNGLIPDNLLVLHSCDNPPCVNPSHLRVGTSADNTKDRIIRHPQTGKNNPNYRHGRMCKTVSTKS